MENNSPANDHGHSGGRLAGAGRKPRLKGDGFAGPILRLQDFGLKSGGFAGHGPADVFMNAARVQFAAAFDVARGAHPQAKIRFVGPIDLIVPTAKAGAEIQTVITNGQPERHEDET